MLLTTLANVRSWVGSQVGTDDGLLSRLITVASQQILQELGRPDLGLTTVTEVLDGRGTQRIQLRNWPVLSVSALTIDGQVIPASTGYPVFGYLLEALVGAQAGRAQNLSVVGTAGYGGIAVANGVAQFAPAAWQPGGGYKPFLRGVGNISVTYQYGYAVQNEAQTIPAATPYILLPNAPYGSYGGDLGVSYATGGALAAQPAGTSLTTGQYIAPTLSGENPVPNYQFASGDEGKAVLLNYNYVPGPVEQACIETVGERYSYKGRIGMKTKSLGGEETAAYDISGLTMAVMELIKPYKLTWQG
jgi:hypothetical protein